MSMVDDGRLRALVIEDEWVARNYLVELLDASGLAEIVGAVGTVDEVRQTLQSPHGPSIEVVFVDVQLGTNPQAGLELVRSLERASSLMFVLATAVAKHAAEAFDLGVVDYLVKPYTEERVEQCLRRLIARRPASRALTPRKIVARRDRSIVFLQPEEVWAFEASDRLTSVHTAHGKFDIDLSLASIEASVGRTLLRVHRNWLVNKEHVKELHRDGNESRLFVGTSGGAERRGLFVPVARERAQTTRETLLAGTTGLRETVSFRR
jgi:DNA-binding LytR/AlgR family response regulator